MSLKRIRMELARTPEFPEGSRRHGYEFTAPLTSNGHLDPDGWHANRDLCRVRRFWGDNEDEIGHLVRKPGGSWAFHYDIHGDEDDDEAGYRFGDEAFVPGEYISVREHDDELRAFRVITVHDIPGH